MLKMDLEYQNGILFIRLKGNLNRRTKYKFDCYLNPLLEKHKIKKVIYNLSQLKSVDESGIDAVLKTKCIIRRNKGKIYLCEANDFILLKIARLRIKTTSSEKIALRLIEV